MKMSDVGLELTKASEGLRLNAYQDTGGVWTIGYGHTRGVKKGQVITAAQAETFLRADLADAESLVLKYAPGLPQPAFDALVDFAFNLGPQAFHNKDGKPTGVMKCLTAKDYTGIPAQFKRWIYDNGHEQPGLIIRRKAEGALWKRAFA